MPRYKLLADKPGAPEGQRRREHGFMASDDFDATTTAIDYILNHAVGHTEPWATGHIVLSRSARGLTHVVHEMAAK
jgi:hypothetical protein